MSVIADLPDLRPSLLLDFANSRRVDPRIQCTRASSATCCGPDGKLRIVAANVPRIDHDPVTGKCLGLLVEEACANTGLPLIASGSVPQVPTYTYNAGLPPLVAGRVPIRNYAVGAVDASNAAGSRANIRTDPSGLTENTTYTASIYVCGVKDGATRVTMYLAMSGFTALSTTVDLAVGAWRRLVLTITLPTGVSGTGALRVAGSGGADPLQPFGADGYQFEVGASASSYIPTEASAVARAADVASLVYSANPRGGALLCESSVAGASATSFVARLHEASAAYIGVHAVSASGQQRAGYLRAVGDSTGLVASVSGPALINNAKVKAAIGWSSGMFVSAIDGAVSEGVPATNGFPTPSLISFGRASTGGSTVMSARIERIALYGAPLTSEQLQRLTA